MRPAAAVRALAAIAALASLPLGRRRLRQLGLEPYGHTHADPDADARSTATPDPNVPPAGSGCGEPYPPMVTRFQAKIHQKDKDFWQLDSTPLVGPNVEYCWSVGFTDGRSICPVRPRARPTVRPASCGASARPRTPAGTR